MGMCKECKEVFSALEMTNGYCKNCYKPKVCKECKKVFSATEMTNGYCKICYKPEVCKECKKVFSAIEMTNGYCKNCYKPEVCKECKKVFSEIEMTNGYCKNCYKPEVTEDNTTGKYKIISDTKNLELKLKDSSNIYSELQERLNNLSENGWEVVCTGPERNVIFKRNFFIELLRAIPIINLLINLFFPQIITTSVSMILKKIYKIS